MESTLKKWRKVSERTLPYMHRGCGDGVQSQRSENGTRTKRRVYLRRVTRFQAEEQRTSWRDGKPKCQRASSKPAER
jgi:hypothetical protein